MVDAVLSLPASPPVGSLSSPAFTGRHDRNISAKERAMRTRLQDLRYAMRQLLKLPGFTLTAVLSLALGIGATTAVFSVVYAILMDPYPYAAPDRMIHMRLAMPDGKLRFVGVTGTQWKNL